MSSSLILLSWTVSFFFYRYADRQESNTLSKECQFSQLRVRNNISQDCACLCVGMLASDMKRMGLLLFSFSLNAIVTQYVIKFSALNILQAIQLSGKVMMLFIVPLFAFAFILPYKSTLGHQPPLSLQTILLFVYGVGVFLFVAILCFLGVVVTPVFWFTLGMAALAVDESVVGQRGKVYPLNSWICIFAATAGPLLLVVFSQHNRTSMVEAIDQGDWISIFFGILLPVAVAMIPYSIRLKGGYSVRQVLQFMHWGYPTLLALGASVVCFAPCDTVFPNSMLKTPRNLAVQSDQFISNYSYVSTFATFNFSSVTSETKRLNFTQTKIPNFTVAVENANVPHGNFTAIVQEKTHHESLFLFFVPLTLFPVVFLTFLAMLQYGTLDIMCVNTSVVTFQHFMLHPNCVVAGPAVLVAAIALALRLYSLSQQPAVVERIPTRFYVEEITEYSDI